MVTASWGESVSVAEAWAQTPVEFVVSVRSSGGDFTTVSGALTNHTDLTSPATRVFPVSAESGLSSGSTVTGAVSGATATVVAVTNSQILLESISGDFAASEAVEDGSGNSATLNGPCAPARYIVELYDDWAAGLTDYPEVYAYWGTDAVHYIEIRAATGEAHPGYWSGAAGGGARILGNIAAYTAYVRITNIAIKPTNATAIAYNANGVLIVDRCILNGNACTGVGNDGIAVDNGTAAIWNTAIYRFPAHGIVKAVNATLYVYHCTIYSCQAYGVYLGDAVYNTAAVDCDPDYSFTSAAHLYNVSGDNTATGPGSQRNVTAASCYWTSTTANIEDFRIANAASVLYRGGWDGVFDDPQELGYVGTHAVTGLMRPRGAHGAGVAGPADIGCDDRQLPWYPADAPDPTRLEASGSDTKFLLTGDVDFTGSGIVCQGNDIYLNLGGYTISFASTTDLCSGLGWGSNFRQGTIVSFAEDIPTSWNQSTSRGGAFNGTLQIAPAATTVCHRLVSALAPYLSFHDLTMLDNGDDDNKTDRYGIHGYYTSSITVRDCTITMTGGLYNPSIGYTTPSTRSYWYSRHKVPAAVCMSEASSTVDFLFTGNTIRGRPCACIALKRAGGVSYMTGYCRIANNHLYMSQPDFEYANVSPIYTVAGDATIEDNLFEIPDSKGVELAGQNSGSTFRRNRTIGGWGTQPTTYHYGTHGLSIREGVGNAGAVLFQDMHIEVTTYDQGPWASGVTYGAAAPGDQNTFRVEGCRFIVSGTASSTVRRTAGIVSINTTNAASNRVFTGCNFDIEGPIIFYRGDYNSTHGSVCRNTRFRHTGTGQGHVVAFQIGTSVGIEQRGLELIDCEFIDYGMTCEAVYDWGGGTRTRAGTENYVKYSIISRVVDSNGDPVSGASITIQDGIGTIYGPYSTNAHGYVVGDGISGRPGPFTAHVFYVSGSTAYSDDRSSFSVTAQYGGWQHTTELTLDERTWLTFTVGTGFSWGEAPTVSDDWATEITRSPTPSRAWGDAVSASDAWAATISRAVEYADGATVSDAWDADRTVGLPLDGTTYYVRCRVRDETGAWSDWSAYDQVTEDDNNYFVMATVTGADLLDGATASDAWVAAITRAAAIGDGATAADGWSVGVDLAALAWGDAATVADAWVKVLSRRPRIGDSVEIADAWVARRSTYSLSESATVRDRWVALYGAPSPEQLSVTSRCRTSVTASSQCRATVSVTSRVI